MLIPICDIQIRSAQELKENAKQPDGAELAEKQNARRQVFSLVLLLATCATNCLYLIVRKSLYTSFVFNNSNAFLVGRLVQNEILLELGGSSPLHCDRVAARQVSICFPFATPIQVQ